MSNKIVKVPLLGNILEKINQDALQYGPQTTALKLINRIGCKLEVHGKNQEIENLLKDKPVIVVANHPHDSDTIPLVASLPPREDASIIATALMLGLVPNLDKYIIPVHVEHHDIRNRTYLRRVLRIFNPVPIFSSDTEHQKNVKSIEIAVNKINNGGMIIIFPGTGYAEKWYPGIGYLIKNSIQKNLLIINAFIENTSNLYWFRLIPLLGKLFPPVKITFSKPRETKEISTLDPKRITSILEEEYNNWVKSLN